MSAAVLFLDLCDDGPETSRAALELAEILDAPLILATREPVFLRRLSTARIEVPRPSTLEQVEVWRHALPAGTFCPPEILESVAAQFRGGWITAETAAATLRGTLEAGAEPGRVASALHDACRLASRRRLDSLAARITCTVGWEDLVVPSHTSKPLHEIAASFATARRVYEAWGFGDRSDRGLGVSALFHGDSGTGKTLAAEVIANELALDLYRVDLSRVVSKYIGETEKNLRRVFDAAEESGAILLFDEADALFGKRSEVKDSHDRYANVEVSYLLSRMETYRGLAILTTNLRRRSTPPSCGASVSSCISRFPTSPSGPRSGVGRSLPRRRPRTQPRGAGADGGHGRLHPQHRRRRRVPGRGRPPAGHPQSHPGGRDHGVHQVEQVAHRRRDARLAMTPAPKITLKIASVVLHGAPGAHAARLAGALKAELGRLLAAPGAIPPALVSGAARRSRIDAGSFTPASARSGATAGTDARGAAADGTAIARNVYRSLTGGTTR